MPQPVLDSSTLISVVIPIYNEEENVRALLERLEEVFSRMGCRWEAVFALDPSPDGTREEILRLIGEGRPIRLVRFSRRIGKPLSLLAGLEYARGDACVIIDADLQDPPELIGEMAAKWRQGFKVVIAQRASRKGESLLYLKAAQLFYWLAGRITDAPPPPDTGDFRLLDASVVREVVKYRERHGFLRGITASLGFPTAVIPFHRDSRKSGKTNIPLLGALNIALDGIIPFSRLPIRAVFWLGSAITAASGAWGLVWLLRRLFFHTDPSVIEGLMIWSAFLTGLLITCLGVVGEYVLRIYEEARDRPRYVVEEVVDYADQAGSEG